jgi:multimeric flavodoxin WrbA
MLSFIFCIVLINYSNIKDFELNKLKVEVKMNIFVYVGSPRGDKSIGYLFAKKVEEYFKLNDIDSSFNIYRDDELNIMESDGSVIDFYNGETMFDDDMKIIEKDLIKSDFVIFISPVYAHNVSSQTKKFIDRLSYWLHIFRLVGKKGFAVSVSYNNGNQFVNDYLTEIMQYLGIYVLGDMSLQTVNLNEDKKIIESYANFLAKKIVLSEEVMEIEIPYQQEKSFELEKEQYLHAIKDSSEKRYWQDNGYLEYNTFKELFLDKMNKNA